MSVPSLEELERQLSALPPEAWDRPVPPPPPWRAGAAHAAAPGNGARPAAPGAERNAGPPARRRAHAAGPPHASTAGPAPRRSRRRHVVLRPLAAAALSVALLAAGLGAGLLLAPGGDEAPGGPEGGSIRVELRPVGGARAAGVADLARHSATVRLSGLPPSAGDFYELWLLGADGELVSLGSVRVPPSGRTELRVRIPVDPAGFRYLDVSREPADGDPGHSGDSLLRGPTS